MSAVFIPPAAAGIIELLSQRGHTVVVRRNRNGSNRYRIDSGRELLAIEMDRFYFRTYDQELERAQ